MWEFGIKREKLSVFNYRRISKLVSVWRVSCGVRDKIKE
jgi:hypothetical protein